MDDARPARPNPGGWMPLGVALAVLLSRLPFLGPGLGTDNDAWAVAGAARAIAARGVYTVSRFPGYPLHEGAAALLQRGGLGLLDVASALMAALAAALIAIVLRRAGSRDAALGAVAFAFVPVVFIASTSGIDYLWACAFLMAALALALRGHRVAGGLALGIATGLRITSIAYALPLGLLCAWSAPRARWRAGLALALPAVLVGAVSYVPVALRYGSEFLSYYEPAGGHEQNVLRFIAGFATLYRLPIPPLYVAGLASVGVWGVLGSVALGVTIVWTAAPHRRHAVPGDPPAGAPPGLLAASAVAIAVCLLLFLRLPDDEGYLIPAVPFVFIVLARRCERRAFQAFCVAVLLSPFVLGVDATPPKKGVTPATRSPLARALRPGGREAFVIDPLRGPLLMDRDKRRAQMDILARARARWTRLPPDAVVLAGLLDLPLHLIIRSGTIADFDIVTLDDLRRMIREGRPVFYLPDAPGRTARFFHYSLEAEGARPFPLDAP